MKNAKNWIMTIIACLVIIAFGLVALLVGDVDKFQAFIAFAGPMLVTLLAVIRIEQAKKVTEKAANESEKTNKTLNGNLTSTVENVVHDVLEGQDK